MKNGLLLLTLVLSAAWLAFAACEKKQTDEKPVTAAVGTENSADDAAVQNQPVAPTVTDGTKSASIDSVEVKPNAPKRENEVKCIASGRDPDGNTVTFSYRWYVNGSEVYLRFSDTLKPTDFSKGDEIYCKASALSANGSSDWKESPTVKAANSTPTIIKPPTINGAGTVDVIIEAKDLDGDSIKFSMTGGPAGMRLDETTGRLTWSPQISDSGEYNIEFTVTDSEGAYSKMTAPLNFQVTQNPEYLEFLRQQELEKQKQGR